jgi:hypothetical protein
MIYLAQKEGFQQYCLFIVDFGRFGRGEEGFREIGGGGGNYEGGWDGGGVVEEVEFRVKMLYL